jgi:hypothetical protein
MFDAIGLSVIQDKNTRQLVNRLLNLIEKFFADMRDCQAENQRLRDVNIRMNGEKCNPKVKGKTAKPAKILM